MPFLERPSPLPSPGVTDDPRDAQKLMEWTAEHPDAFLGDMQLFLKKQFGVDISIPTISRQLRNTLGTQRRKGRAQRLKAREQRQAEGRSLDLELHPQQAEGGGQPPPSGPEPVNAA